MLQFYIRKLIILQAIASFVRNDRSLAIILYIGCPIHGAKIDTQNNLVGHAEKKVWNKHGK